MGRKVPGPCDEGGNVTLSHAIAQMLEDWAMRYQDPTLQRTSGRNPRWFIRPVIPQVTPTGLLRIQKRIILGACADMTRKDALRAKQRVMAEINGGAAVIQGQLRLVDLVGPFREARLPMPVAKPTVKVS